MATGISLSITVLDHWTDGKRIHVIGSVNVNGSGDYVSGGLALPLIDPTNPIAIKSPSPPEFVQVQSILGYNYNYNYATGFLLCFTSGRTEISGSAAWPENNMSFYMVFPKYVNNTDVQNYWENI